MEKEKSFTAAHGNIQCCSLLGEQSRNTSATTASNRTRANTLGYVRTA